MLCGFCKLKLIIGLLPKAKDPVNYLSCCCSCFKELGMVVFSTLCDLDLISAGLVILYSWKKHSVNLLDKFSLLNSLLDTKFELVF